jgi:hypothetical protein
MKTGVRAQATSACYGCYCECFQSSKSGPTQLFFNEEFALGIANVSTCVQFLDSNQKRKRVGSLRELSDFPEVQVAKVPKVKKIVLPARTNFLLDIIDRY